MANDVRTAASSIRTQADEVQWRGDGVHALTTRTAKTYRCSSGTGGGSFDGISFQDDALRLLALLNGVSVRNLKRQISLEECLHLGSVEVFAHQ